MNKVRWDMRFPPADIEIKTFKRGLESILEELSSLVRTDPETKTLAELQKSLSDAESERELIRIHRQMIREFAFYSEGRDLFGPGLTPMDAPAGTYQVILTVDGKQFSGSVTLRDDPILQR